MGLLDQALGQVLGGSGASVGGMSAGSGLGGPLSANRAPIAMAILSLLASKHLSGGVQPGGMTNRMAANPAPAGSILDKLGGIFGSGSAATAGATQPSGGLGSLLGAGATGGALAGGLGDLLSRFTHNGHGAIAESWVGTAQNAAVSPDQLNQVLGSSTVDDLSQQTGLERGDLLSQLSAVLPQVVDRLTPHGRLPNEDEHSQWI